MSNSLKANREQIYLAALLHDIGKIGQRFDIDRQLSDNDCSSLCPKDGTGNFYTHRHVWWTQYFMEELIKEKKLNSSWKYIAYLAKSHHVPNDINTAIISKADGLAAGVDRNYPYDDEFKDFRKVTLTSILTEIKLSSKHNDIELAFFDLKPLTNENIYPSPKFQDKATKEKYYYLWDNLRKDIGKINFEEISVDALDFTLHHILRKYMWSVPADTQSFADISLYEHSKLTSAFALAIYDYISSSNNYNYSGGWIDLKGYPFAFVGVDISGIQSFIYDIISNKAAKSLKGRSFYLELLTIALIEKFKDIFQAFYGQIVYAAGSKFYAIVANVDIEEKISRFQKEVELVLWKEHRDKLSVIIDAIVFNIKGKKIILDEGKTVKLGNLWSALTVKLNNKKNKKFLYVIKEDKEFFKPKKVKGNNDVCAVTGIELTERNKDWLDEDKTIPVTKIVKKQVNIGTKLKRAKWIIMTNEVIDQEPDIKILDRYFYILTDNLPQQGHYKAYKINDTELPIEFNDKVGFGYLFYAGAKIPENKNGYEKNTSDLALTDDGNSTMLGVLRMDVDSLGEIFSIGLSKDYQSFGAYATMSFLFNLFFTKYLSELRENDKYKNWVNILYAGGDDLFIFGRWKEVLDFAEVIKNQFYQFVHNSNITLSGGLAFVHGKFPISKAAYLSQEAEELSKTEDKNAITFFGNRLSWDKEFMKVKRYKNLFLQMITDYGLSKGFLHSLIRFKEIKDRGEKAYLWISMYYLARLAKRYEKKKTVKEFIEQLMKDYFQSPYLYDLLAISARWAEKELQTIKSN